MPLGFNNLACRRQNIILSVHVFAAPTHPVPVGTATGEISGAAASTGDNRHSTRVRIARKRKSVEQGTYNSSI